MAEETLNVVETEVTEQVDTQTEVETPQEKTYTETELQKIIKDRISREKKAAEKAIQEAEKLAKMNQDEKKQYEFEQLQKELEELKRKDARYSMSAEATKMLSEHNVPIDEHVFEIVVKDTAEETKERVDWFVKYVTGIAGEMSKKALSGTAPKVAVRTGSAVTKESIMAEKDPSKRIRLIQEHPELF